MKRLLETILVHDRVTILTDFESKSCLLRLLYIVKKYLGTGEYIEHGDDDELFEDFLILNKERNKKVISTSMNVWLSNSHITDLVFDNVKFILPYKNMVNHQGLPNFVGGHMSLPSILTYKSDLILNLSHNILTFSKIRYGINSDIKIDLEQLLLKERNMKICRLKTMM